MGAYVVSGVRCGEDMRASTLLAICVLVLAPLAALGAQENTASSRRDFLAPATATTDDPRRIPVGPNAYVPPTKLVLRGGRVFDGTGRGARSASVVIEGKTIVSVTEGDPTRIPAGARVIEVNGATVMPGLIDLHTHVAFPTGRPDAEIDESQALLNAIERLNAYAASGITSIRDCASMGVALFRLKEAVAQDKMPLPRIFASGQVIVGRGGHAAEILRPLALSREASGADDWREAVREQFEKGADFIKLASHFSRAEISAAVEEAHALGLRVTVDSETFYTQWAVEAGVDMVEHPLPRSGATIELMASKGVASIPTLVPYIYIADQFGGYFGSTSRRFTSSPESNFAMLRKLKAAGITLGVGTDLIFDWHRTLPFAYITELKQFVAAGLSPAEALVAATSTNARLLDMGEKIGTLAAGKLADIMVVRGRPDEVLDDLANVVLVVRNGSVIVEQGISSLPRHEPQRWRGR